MINENKEDNPEYVQSSLGAHSEELTQRARLSGLEPKPMKKYNKKVECHACYMNKKGWQCHICLTSSRQVAGMAKCCPQSHPPPRTWKALLFSPL